MKEYELEVLEQYDIEVKNVKRGRNSFLLDTDCGLCLLQSTGMSERRAESMNRLCLFLKDGGFRSVDSPIANREGAFVSKTEDGTVYLVKKWFAGRECNVQKEYEITEAVKNLAFLHNILAEPADAFQEEVPVGERPEEEMQRYNQKLRKIRRFVRKRPAKNDFELLFLNCFEEMYAFAETVTEQAAACQKLYEDSRQKQTMVHGDYNYHNLIMTAEGIAVVNFENFRIDIQAGDLYYFMRKIMEKNHWDRHLGEQIIRSYTRIHPLSEEEMKYLALRLAYPEKFFKAANTYYQSNKARIPQKSVEKLMLSVRETKEKKQFLEDIFSFHLQVSGV